MTLVSAVFCRGGKSKFYREMGAKNVSNISKKAMHGVHAPHFKNTTEMAPEVMPVPEKVYISLHQHMGAPSTCLVKKGDPVKVGQKIGEASSFMSANTHSSVSGVVDAITTMTNSMGGTDQYVVIKTDGLQEVSEEVKPPVVENYQDFLAAVKESGLVGLGGAGFPTHVKFNLKDLSAVDTLVVNGAECEPYITTDYRTIVDKTQDLLDGARAVAKYLELKDIYVGIEDNKPKAIELLKQQTANDPAFHIVSMPASYPKGAEKVIVYECTGRVIKEGQLPFQAGVIVSNVTSLAFLGQYLKTGMPLVTKTLTIDGSAIAEPKNVVAPIGAMFQDIVAFCGGYKEEPVKMLMGGPMMGITIYSDELPMTKNNNAMLAFGAQAAKVYEETACIRCGRCVRACPMNLMPAAIETAYKLKKVDELKALKVNLCIECGCCSYVCPAHRSLVVTNKMAKRLIAPPKK